MNLVPVEKVDEEVIDTHKLRYTMGNAVYRIVLGTVFEPLSIGVRPVWDFVYDGIDVRNRK